MKKGIVLAVLLVCAGGAAAQAERPGMSASKLSSLGLSSMQPVDDTVGLEVRGQGGRIFISGTGISVAGPSSSTFSYGAQARGPNLVGFGGSQTFAEHSVVSNNFFRTANASTFGRSLVWAP